MNTRILAACALVGATAPVSAQSFNLDFGEPTAGPSSSYAAAGLPGYWNAIHGDGGTYYFLNDLSGNPTSVHFSQSGAAGLIAANDPSLSGDDALLMNDGLITYTFGVDSCFYFNGLEPGTYELITYAWRPSNPVLMAKSFVDNTPGVEISGGAWPGHHVHGVTYARTIVSVDSSGFLGPHSGLAAGSNQAVGAVCNGMQLRRLDEHAPFCAGDGSLLTACPCLNTGATRNGCANSFQADGALLSAAGTTTPDAIVLSVSGELPSALSIFLQGTSSSSSGVHFGDGVRCVSGTLKRLYVKNASGSAVSAPGAGDPSITVRSSALGDPILPGSTRYYQTYYRDPNLAFCAAPQGDSFNVTNGVIVVW